MATNKVQFERLEIVQESWRDTLKKFRPFIVPALLAGAGSVIYAQSLVAQPYYTLIPLAGAIGTGIAVSFALYGKSVNVYKNIGVENEEGKRYFVHVGNIVRKIYGDTKKTASAKNAVYPLLLNFKEHATHYAIMGTTGSGKTVTMQNIMEEVLESGSGFIFVDGKGSTSMIRTIYALAYKYRREKDFQIINFANPELSDSLDFFSMDENDIVSILKMMIEDMVSASPEWGHYGNEVAISIIRVCKELDKRGLFFTEKTMNEMLEQNDVTLERVRAANERLTFESYFDFFMEDVVFKWLHVLKTIGIDEEVYKELESNFVNASNITKSDLWDLSEVEGKTLLEKVEAKYKKLVADIEQFAYGWKVGRSYWTDARDKILKEYRQIFHIEENSAPAVNIPTTLALGKILYYVLPGTDAETNVKFASTILFANIRSYYTTLKNNRTLPLPYTLFLDEMNSWAHTVQGIGALMSQTREQNLAFVCGFQTALKLDREGREASMIWGNANTKIVLKVDDPELIEMINKNFDEVETAENDANETDRVQKNRRTKFKKDEIKRLAAGESYLIRGEYVVPFVSKYRPPIIYRPTEEGVPPTDTYTLPPLD